MTPEEAMACLRAIMNDDAAELILSVYGWRVESYGGVKTSWQGQTPHHATPLGAIAAVYPCQVKSLGPNFEGAAELLALSKDCMKTMLGEEKG